MLRRNFLKLVGCLPFGLFNTKPQSTETEHLNGTIWGRPPYFCRKYIVIWGMVIKDEWYYALISAPYRKGEGLGTATTVCHLDAPPNYEGVYTEQQLREKLKTWKRFDNLELRLWNNEANKIEWPD